MTYLIANRPWVDLSDFTDSRGLWDHLPKVAESIARSCHTIMPCIVGGRANLLEDDLEMSDVAVSDAIQVDCAKQIKGMNVGQIYTFTKFMYEVADLALLIPIRKSNSYQTKHLAAETADTLASKHWEWFYTYLKNLNVFSEIGRIACFINERGQPTLPHQDYLDGQSRRDQFLFFTHPRKKFWIMIDGQKHYITSPVSTFDNANYHGSDTPEYPVWSLRVDGVFNDDFLERSYLKSHYANGG